MSREKNLQIRESILNAHEQEDESNSLEHFISNRIASLHPSIALSGINNEQALGDFVARYIDHVPDFLEALIDIAECAGIYHFIEKIVGIAQSYFLSPPDLVDAHSGLYALIDEAYLAHRLMEEVNDRVMMHCNLPLIPMDTMMSNVIIHSLIGDEFANELDLAVHYAIEALFQDEACIKDPCFLAYIELHKAEGWEDIVNEWPCLMGDSPIRLAIESSTLKTRASETLH